jgi:hypothetical protein
MRRPRLEPQSVAAIVALVVLGTVAVLTARTEPPPYEPYASTDYRAGGYRAWAALLAREGIAVGRFVLRPVQLDRGIDTLISAQSPAAAGVRSAADVGALAAWVRGGGRLVYLGRSAALESAERRFLNVPQFLPKVGPRGALSGPAAAEVPRLSALGPDRMLLIEHPGTALLADGNGAIVVRYPLGRGEVVAVSGAEPFANAHIAAADNARLAVLVARPREPGGRVAFDDGLHGALVDRPWYLALPVALRVALALAAVALVAGLAGSALREGPAVRLEPPREPGTEEFVAALAALYERTAARANARSVLARDALGAAARSVGLAADVPPALLVARFGDRPGSESLGRLVAALDAPVATDAELVAASKLAYDLRREVTDGGNGDGRRAAFAGRARARRRW